VAVKADVANTHTFSNDWQWYARGSLQVTDAPLVSAEQFAAGGMYTVRGYLSAEAIGDWRLTGCTLLVTLEPCCMCAGAIVLARIDRLVYGAADPKAGAVETLYRLCSDPRLNHQVEIIPGVLADRCSGLLTDFFRKQRDAGKK